MFDSQDFKSLSVKGTVMEAEQKPNERAEHEGELDCA